MKKGFITRIGLAKMIFVIAMIAGFCFGHSAKADAAIKCYTIGTSNIQVYSNTGLTSRYGVIYPTDEIIVNKVTDRYCRVTYPIARGTKTGYIHTGEILTKTTGNSYVSRAKITTYRRAANNNSYGYIAKGDSVKVLGTAGNYTQVKYPVSGGYKYAFVKTADANAYLLSSGSNSGGISNGIYKLVSAINNKYVMDVNGASLSDYANVQLYEDNGSNAQKFEFIRQADGYYVIKNINSGKMLDCAGGGRADGTNIQQYTSNSTAAQRWKVTSVGNGYYTLTCKCNGLLADVDGGRGANWTNIQMYAANGSAAQKWKLVRTTASHPSVSDNVSTSFQMPLVNARCTWRSYSNWSWASKSGTGGGREYHLGIDIAGSSDNVMATANGIVMRCGYNSANGNYVVLKHTISGKTVYSFYAHLASYNVRNGATVAKGSKIGVVGNTGSASRGKHLHFAMMDVLWNGSYYGYATYFTGNKISFRGVTYYNPVYVIQNNRLP